MKSLQGGRARSLHRQASRPRHCSRAGRTTVRVAVAAQAEQQHTAEHVVEAASPRDLDTPASGFDSVPDALAAIANGEFVLVLDDEDRENEGDLIIAADKVTPEKIAFMVQHTSGVLCVGMRGSDCERLQLPQMVQSSENEEEMSTAFTVTVDLRGGGVTTGISAADRSATIRALGDVATVAADLRKPGHVFPLRAREGGVLVRPGHTEAAVDLAYFSGSYPAGLLCEVVDQSTGGMARTPLLQQMAREHRLRIITIADLVRYRLKREVLVSPSCSAALDTRWGEFRATSFLSLLDSQEHMALVFGDVRDGRPLVRIHHEDAVGDTFGVEMCNSQPELDASMQAITAHGSGVLVYVTQQAQKGPRLSTNLARLADLQSGCSVSDGEEVAAGLQRALDVRDFGSVHSMLRCLKVSKTVSLISDCPADAVDLAAFGYEVDRVCLRDLL